MATDLAADKFWVNKCIYHDAEKRYHEGLAKLLKNGPKPDTSNNVNNKKARGGKYPVKNVYVEIKNSKNLSLSGGSGFHHGLGYCHSPGLIDPCIGNKSREGYEYIDSVEPKNLAHDDDMDDVISPKDRKLRAREAKEKKITKSEKKAKKRKEKEEKAKERDEKTKEKEREKERMKLAEMERVAEAKEVKELKEEVKVEEVTVEEVTVEEVTVEKVTVEKVTVDEVKVIPLGGVGGAETSEKPRTSLAGEVARARQHIKTSLECMDGIAALAGSDLSLRVSSIEKDASQVSTVVSSLQAVIERLEKRVAALELRCSACPPPASAASATSAAKEDDDDVDLFGSESEEEDAEAQKVREQRLAAYAAKKSNKPVLIAKSNIILDVKPWDDETDMKQMEKEVRAVKMEGLLWGASKLVPLAYGIHKLQISCVVEDELVSVDQLTETLQEIEDYVQSVDIAAFNKV